MKILDRQGYTFQANIPYLYPLQMSQNYRFSDVLRDIEMQQPTTGVHIKRFSENIQQVYGRTCRRVVSIKLLCNVIGITLRHGWSPVNVLHIFITTFYNKSYSNFIESAFWHGCSAVNLMDIFRTSFPKNTSGGLLEEMELWPKIG